MLSSNLQGLGLSDSPGPSLELPRLQRQQHNDVNEEKITAPATTVKADQNNFSNESHDLIRRLPEIDSKIASNNDTGGHIHYMVEKGFLNASIENLLALHNDTSSIRTAKLIKVGDSSQDSSSAGSTLGSWGGSASGCDLHTALNTGNTTTFGANRDTPKQQEHDICRDFLCESMELIEDMSMPSFCESVELVSLDRTIDESPMKKMNKTPTAMEVSDPKGSSTKSVTFEDQLPASPRTPLTSTSLLDLGDALASSPKIAACTNLIQEGKNSSYLSPKQIVDAKKRSWTEASFASGIFSEAGKLAKDLNYANLSGSSGGSTGSMDQLAPPFSPPLSARIPSPMCSTASPRTPFDNSLELLDLENVDDSLLQMSPIELGPPLVTKQSLPGVPSKVARSNQEEHLHEFSSIPPHELLLGDQQMPDFDPTRGSILAFREQIPERGSIKSMKKDVENIAEAKEGGENTTESNVPKLERENTMDLLSGLSSHSQKLKTLVGLGKTEEPKKTPEDVLNKTFEEIAAVDSKPLNGTFDTEKDTATVGSNLNVTVEQPNTKPVVAAAAAVQVLNGTFDQDVCSNLNVTIEQPNTKPVVAAAAVQVLNGTFDQDGPKDMADNVQVLNGTFDQEQPTVTDQPNNPGMFQGTFNHPEFKNYCNLDLTFDQPDLMKGKQENIQKKTGVLNGTFDQEELKKDGNLDGTFVQPDPSKQNQLNGTFDHPESKSDVALNNTFDHPESKSVVALNNTFDQNIKKKPETALNGTFDNPKIMLDSTFEATETYSKGPILPGEFNGTFDRGDSGVSNTTFDYISDTKPDTVLDSTFDQNEEKIVDVAEDLNTTNLMDCGREALQQFINLGTPTKGKMVASSTPKPAAKEGPAQSTKGNVSKDSKLSFLQRMSRGLINQQEPTQQGCTEEEPKANDPSSSSKLVAAGPKLADLSRESAATALRVKQKSLVERSTKAPLGPVKALPFRPTPQTDDTMDVAAGSGEADSPKRRMTYNVPCDPSSPLGQFRKKLGISVGSSQGSVSESLLNEANKMATDMGDVKRGSQSTSISRLPIEPSDDLLEGISVLKDANSDGSASDFNYKFILPEGKPKELNEIQNQENLDFEGSDEVFISPNEAFATPDKIESQEDPQDASTDSGSSDISVKSNQSVKQSKLGRPQMRAPQSLPKARTSLLPAGNKRSSLHRKSKLQSTVGLNNLSSTGSKSVIDKAATLPAQFDVNKVKSKTQSKISPPLQRNSLAPKAIAPKTNINTRQSLAPKSMTTRQSLAPNPATTRTSLAPKPIATRTSLAPKPTATRTSLAPKPTATRTSLAPKPTATRTSLAPKPTATRQSLAPKIMGNRQSLAPKPALTRQSLAPKAQTDKPSLNNRQSIAPKPTVVTTRQSLAPKPVASTGLPKPSAKSLAKPSLSSKPTQKDLASPKPVTKSLQRPGSPKVLPSGLPQNTDLKTSSKQSPRKSNEENSAPERKICEMKKQAGLKSPSKKSPKKSNEENKAPERKFGLMKPQTRVPMKAGILEDATNVNPSSDTTTTKGTGISRLAALKKPGLGLNNVIDKKQVSKVVRKSSCLDTSPSSENDSAPVSKFPKLAKNSREPSSDNLKITRKQTISSYGSTNSIDSDRPCTPDMGFEDINVGTPNVYRPGSSSMITSTPAMTGGYMGRLANFVSREDNLCLPTPIPSAGSRLRFTSDKSTPTSMN